MRSQVRSTSPMMCDEKSRLIPNSRFVFRISASISSRPFGSSPTRRLVEEDEDWIVHERLRELHALLHSGRVPADRTVALLEQPDMAQRLGRAGARVRPRQAADLRHVGEELGRRDVLRQAVVLRHVPEAAPHCHVGRGRLAEHLCGARGRLDQAEEELDRRALPGSVRPEQPGDGLLDLEVDLIERHDLAVALRQSPSSEQYPHAVHRRSGLAARRRSYDLVRAGRPRQQLVVRCLAVCGRRSSRRRRGWRSK